MISRPDRSISLWNWMLKKMLVEYCFGYHFRTPFDVYCSNYGIEPIAADLSKCQIINPFTHRFILIAQNFGADHTVPKQADKPCLLWGLNKRARPAIHSLGISCVCLLKYWKKTSNVSLASYEHSSWNKLTLTFSPYKVTIIDLYMLPLTMN